MYLQVNLITTTFKIGCKAGIFLACRLKKASSRSTEVTLLLETLSVEHDFFTLTTQTKILLSRINKLPSKQNIKQTWKLPTCLNYNFQQFFT